MLVLLLLEQPLESVRLRSSLLQLLEHVEGGIVLGPLDVLAVVPIGRFCEDVGPNVDAAGPGGAASSAIRVLLVDGRGALQSLALLLELLLPRDALSRHVLWTEGVGGEWEWSSSKFKRWTRASGQVV